jgi:hypothetical protein
MRNDDGGMLVSDFICGDLRHLREIFSRSGAEGRGDLKFEIQI